MFPNHIESESSSRLSRPTRRRFLRTSSGLILGAALTAAIGNPAIAEAQASSWPIQSDENWWPFTKQGKMRVFDENGPLDQYDKWKGTNIRKEFEDFAMWALSQIPESLYSTQGLCNLTAITNRELGRLRAAQIVSKKQVDGVYADPIKKGVLDAYHAGMVFYRPTGNIAQNRQYFLDNLKNTNTSFIADINVDNNDPGEWYHVVQAYDEASDEVEIYGFGKKRWISASAIGKSCLPETVDEAVLRGRNSLLIAENKAFRFDGFGQTDVYQFTGLL